ncbi:hypothetical protein KP803_08940 [Vibrio sp. ZSDE26]|uniref:Copper resistance protein n=1 Tax=Vibrio amylolyticus TaxID=2847292 RepID=A0A9X1XK74_9VIBR|nr:hypothetical protein [Vibrio amylolyticus]MCK6263403.1 hypothetical protein [Vibrio amylolyticus]
MQISQSKYKLARWSLAIVWWVVFVCVAQNSGFFQVCSVGYSIESPTFSKELVTVKTGSNSDTTGVTQECELSKQLLNHYQHQVDDYPLMMFVFALLFIATLMSLPNNFASFTEPIVPKRRPHLILCVFRE